MATHIIGGEFVTEYLRTVGNQWEYRVTLRIYRDCGSQTNAPFDDPLVLTVFDSSGQVVRLDTMFLFQSNIDRIIPFINNPCLVTPPYICAEVAVYERTFRYPITGDGYLLSYQRCCRNGGIVNINNPGATGATYSSRIPGTNEINNIPNSSPEFIDYPPMILCLDDPLVFDHSATDADGDSLVYELCTPNHGGGDLKSPGNSPNHPIPIPSSPPPFPLINWNPPYTNSNQMSANPLLSIDPITGLLTGTPNSSGKYVVGICVSEYRNGALLCTSTRDFQFTVTVCDPNSIAAASNQDRFCDGLDIKFRNQSQNAWSYFWDFGDLTTTLDTSSEKEPTYTYPDTGKYIITLIANPGYSCADTVTTEYAIYKTLEPYFQSPEGQCFDEHSFTLLAQGLFQEYANFEWEFGPKSVTSGSFNPNPSNIRYKDPGAYPVKLTVRENGCEESYTDTLKVYPNPITRFDVEERSNCAPAIMKFTNGSEAWSHMSFLWDFGDGTTSSEPEPQHYYPEPGIYTINLAVSVSEVCTTTTLLTKEKFIRVNEVPVAAIIAEPLIVSINDPKISFQDISVGAAKCNLFLGDDLKSTYCDYEHHYRKPGRYIVTQIVESQYGCPDTNQFEVAVRPDISIFIPNSFTPNSDGINEIYKPVGEVVFDYNFYIYDRWGKIVYYTTMLKNGWNGMIDGLQAPQDVYVYHIKFRDAIGDEKEFRGTFTLVR